MSVSRFSFLTIVLAAMLVQGASDIYTPSLPSIAHHFHTTIDMAQWSLAIYMLGVSMTQLIYGPISDVLGRKPVMIFGIVIFLLGSLFCVKATNIHMLLLGRFIQGLGAGAPSSLWRASFRDLYSGPKLAVYASYLTIIISAVFPMAPALGGFLETSFSWKASFTFMCAYGVFLLCILTFFFQETNKSLSPKLPNLSNVLNIYKGILRTPIFVSATLMTFIAYGIMCASITVSPILFIHHQGISPFEFGWILCLSSGISLGLSGWVNGRLVQRFTINKMLLTGCYIILLAPLILLLSEHVSSQKNFMIAFLCILYFGLGFIMPNAYAKAFSSLKSNIGYASALYSFIQISGGALLGAVCAYLPDHSPAPLCFLILGCSGVGLCLYFLCLRKHP